MGSSSGQMPKVETFLWGTIVTVTKEHCRILERFTAGCMPGMGEM